jgi:hypothetical protein
MDLMTLYDVVWRQYFRADKDRASVLRACAAWLSAPAPVDAILTAGRL